MSSWGDPLQSKGSQALDNASFALEYCLYRITQKIGSIKDTTLITLTPLPPYHQVPRSLSYPYQSLTTLHVRVSSIASQWHLHTHPLTRQ